MSAEPDPLARKVVVGVPFVLRLQRLPRRDGGMVVVPRPAAGWTLSLTLATTSKLAIPRTMISDVSFSDQKEMWESLTPPAMEGLCWVAPLGFVGVDGLLPNLPKRAV
jgi:hypothetical protein